MAEHEILIDSISRGFERGGSIPGCRLTLSDGSTFFILLSDADALECIIGMPVSDQLRMVLIQGALRWDVCRKALDLLARREHSRSELERKLKTRFLFTRKGPKLSALESERIKKVIPGILDELENKNYINDERFAGLWAESRLRKHPEGMSSLASGLASRGISRDITRDLMDKLLSSRAFTRALDLAGTKLSQKYGMTGEKLVKRLLSRGFTYREIKAWIEEHSDLLSGFGKD